MREWKRSRPHTQPRFGVIAQKSLSAKLLVRQIMHLTNHGGEGSFRLIYGKARAGLELTSAVSGEFAVSTRPRSTLRMVLCQVSLVCLEEGDTNFHYETDKVWPRSFAPRLEAFLRVHEGQLATLPGLGLLSSSSGTRSTPTAGAVGHSSPWPRRTERRPLSAVRSESPRQLSSSRPFPSVDSAWGIPSKQFHRSLPFGVAVRTVLRCLLGIQFASVL